MNDFWINNPTILFEYYYKVIPTQYMTRNEQMNAVTRLAIYFILFILLFGMNSVYILYGLLIIIIITIFYYINKYKPNVTNETNDTNETNEQNEINKTNIGYKPNEKIDPKTIYDNPIFGENEYDDQYKNQVESGYINSDGNYVLGKEYGPFTDKKQSTIQNNKVKKRKPTVDNPYQNIVFSDYLNNETVPEPCNVLSDQIQTESLNLYNSSMFRNTSDIYDRMNSQRLFLTMPVTTIPNDQINFANWLYKTGPTCKENTENCTYYSPPNYQSQRY